MGLGLARCDERDWYWHWGAGLRRTRRAQGARSDFEHTAVEESRLRLGQYQLYAGHVGLVRARLPAAILFRGAAWLFGRAGWPPAHSTAGNTRDHGSHQWHIGGSYRIELALSHRTRHRLPGTLLPQSDRRAQYHPGHPV